MGKINILVVDDEQAEEIKESIQDFTFHEIGCVINTAESIEDAEKNIADKKEKMEFYDIMIVDMKLDELRLDRGLEILKMQLSCIKIVLTSYPSLHNCIQSFKVGRVFDYIDKNSTKYNPVERLKESMKAGLEERLKQEEIPVLVWIRDNLEKLIKQYGGKYIAVIDEIVVDSHKNSSILGERVKQNYPFFRPHITDIPED